MASTRNDYYPLKQVLAEDTTAYLEDVQDTPRSSHPTCQKAPLPVSQIAILWYLQLCEPIVDSVIYPFVNELVSGLDIIHGDPRRVGYYVGLIESAFFMAEFLFILQWGRLSDRYGRKPVIITGLLGVFVSIVSFGFSRTFVTLVISRCLAGLMNGNVGVIKSTIGELTDETNVQDAFRYMPLCWPVGEAIGPLIGGYLSNPSQRFPRAFSSIQVFKTYPYLLPCITASMFPLLGIVLSVLALRESNVKARRRRGPTAPHSPSDSAGPATLPLTPSTTIRSVLTRRVIVAVINYGCLALTNSAYSVLLPLFLSTPIEHGGLGLSPKQIGYILGAQGIVSVIFIVIFCARMQKRFGNAKSFTFAMASLIIVFAAFPIASSMVSGVELSRSSNVASALPWGVWLVLAIQISGYGLLNAGYGSIFVLVTEAAPSKALLGSTNGLAQTVASLTRAIGPASSTSLFAFSTARRHILGGGLVWLILLIISILGIGASLLLDEKTHGVLDEEETVILLENKGFE